MKDAEIREKLKEGWIRAIVTIEVAGKPKKHVDDSLRMYVENLAKDERIAILHEDREEAIEHEDGIFSTFSEIELLAQGLETFTWLCINFSPASVEILEPEDIAMESRDVTNWLNDLLARIHNISADYRSQAGAKEHLVVAMNQLIQNAILLSVKEGPKTEEQIQKETGIHGQQLGPFLEHLAKKGKLAVGDGKYSRA